MNKRKRDQDQYSSDGGEENIDMNEILDSEEEYSENERKLLSKARQRREPENYDSEDEVMGFDNNEFDEDDSDDGEYEKDSMASDIEGLEEDTDLPNEKAWGKKKKAYYSTDYVDPDYASASQKDMAAAEMEEQEARNLQKQLAEQLDDADFGLDFVTTKDNDTVFDEVGECIKTDLSKLSKRQKQELLEKESPEFMPLILDLQDRLTEVRMILGPFLELMERVDCEESSAVNLIRAKYNLLLHYCTNISFYLILKAKREPVASHPVIKRLAQYRQLLTQIEERQGDLIEEIKEILEANKNGDPIYNTSDSSQVTFEKKKQNTKKLSIKEQKKIKPVEKKKKKVAFEGDSSMDEDQSIQLNEKLAESLEDDQEDANEDNKAEAEKRAITYQIAKNKGLTPHRKKEQRNPRVKHRNKYRKAVIRRKGAVREVRKELSRYGGEISGIKASVVKSIKLK